MTEAQAAAAFQEFLEERGPALARLRKHLAADGLDPAALLDGTVESFVPLWRWFLSRLTTRDAPGATDPASVPREVWPSWERYTMEEEYVLSLESLTLLDGLVSYLAAVVLDHVPAARWEIARHRTKSFVYKNYPVLVSGTGENHNFLPGGPAGGARGTLLGAQKRSDGLVARYAQFLIEDLHQAEDVTAQTQDVTAQTVEPEPLFEVEETRDEPGGYDFEIGLSDELAHPRSDEVDRLVLELAGEDGVSEVFREDRDIIHVRAPSWSVTELDAWVSQRI